MNTGNPPHEDEKWQALLARSSATFAGDDAMPFGFVTKTLARLKAEKERDIWERIGLHALFASMAVMVAVLGVSLGVQLQNRMEANLLMKSFVHADELEIS